MLSPLKGAREAPHEGYAVQSASFRTGVKEIVTRFVPRYIDTFEPEEKIEIDDALAQVKSASREFLLKWRELRRLHRANGAEHH